MDVDEAAVAFASLDRIDVRRVELTTFGEPFLSQTAVMRHLRTLAPNQPRLGSTPVPCAILSTMSSVNTSERGKLVPAGSIQPGDSIACDGHFEVVTAVRRAQGRKPSVGENLHLLTEHGIVKANSENGIRVRR